MLGNSWKTHSSIHHHRATVVVYLHGDGSLVLVGDELRAVHEEGHADALDELSARRAVPLQFANL